MSGFKCPKCGQTDEFFADRVLLLTKTRITSDGWDYMYEKHADCELPDSALVTCAECGHEDSYVEFLDD